VKKVFFLLACVACTLSLNGFLGAEGGKEELVIAGEKSPGLQATHLRRVYPEIRANIENALGWKLLSPPTVVLIPDRETFEKMSGSPLFSAFALPSRHSIIIHLSPDTSEPYILNEIFEHELCHLFLHERIPIRLLPKWLDEGICQWISGSLGEILAGKGIGAGRINPALHPIPLRELTVSFPKDRDALIQAYAESRLFVEYLVSHYGKESLLNLLRHLQEGSPIEEAVPRVFSITLQALQEEWLKELGSRRMWLMWIGQYLYEFLFVLAAILTIVAFVRLMIRKRSYDPTEEDGTE
jgi:hypothetical protein